MYLQVEWTSTTTSFQWNELPRPHHFSGMNFHDHIISVEWISTTTSFQWNELPRPHHFSGMNFHDHIISVRGDVWAHITSLTRHVTYYWSVCPKQGKWSVVYLCVRGIDFVSFYDFDIWFRNGCDSVVYLLSSRYLSIYIDILFKSICIRVFVDWYLWRYNGDQFDLSLLF